MIEWPNKKETLDDAYAVIEQHELNVFPIGDNGLWHSGVHIQGDYPIKPLTNGTVVAIRLNKEPVQGEQAKKMSKKRYDKIPAEEQILYKEETTSTGQTIYVLKDEYAESKENFSTSFVLIKHTASIPKSEKEAKTFTFFTLYANLAPYGLLEPEKQYLDTYKPIPTGNNAISVKLPFYQKWIFNITGSGLPQHTYRNGPSKMLFEMSHYKINSDPLKEDTFPCIFDNEPDHLIGISEEHLEFITKHVPANENVPVYYKVPHNTEEEKFYRLTTLHKNAYFAKYNKEEEATWNYQNGYMVVLIKNQETTPANTIAGWYYCDERFFANTMSVTTINTEMKKDSYAKPWLRDYECIQKTDGKIIFKLKRNTNLGYKRKPFTFTEIRNSTSHWDFKIVSYLDYIKKANELGLLDKEPIHSTIPRDPMHSSANFNNEKYFTSQTPNNTSPPDVVIVKRKENIFSPEYSIFPEYIFFNNSNTVDPKYDSSGKLFNELKPVSSSQIQEFSVTQIPVFDEASYDLIEFSSDIEIPNKTLFQKDGLFPCRVSFKEGEYYSVKVKATDLQFESGSGYLKWKNKYCDDIAEGFMVYDTNTLNDGKPTGNARDVLQKNTEFELVDPQAFFSNPQPGFYAVMHENTIRHIRLTNIANIQAKIVVQDKYKEANTIIKPNETISINSYLGYPGKQLNRSLYDLAAFTKDVDFMEATSHEFPIFTIPQAIKFYNRDEKTSVEYYFPRDTILKYETEEKNGRTAYKVSVQSMELYIYRNPAEEVTEGTQYVIGPYNKLVAYTYDIIFDAQNNASTTKPQFQDFATALAGIRNTIQTSTLTCTYIYKEGSTHEPRFLFDFTAGQFSAFQFTFWLKPEDIPESITNKANDTNNGGTLEISSGNSKNKEGITFKAYKESPITGFTFHEKQREGSLAKELEFKRSTGEYEDKQKKVYLGFTPADKDTFYVAKDDVKKVNLLDWDTHFKKMETGKADDIICDKKNDIESHIKPPEGTKNLKAHSNEQRRKLICQHPLEWDKTFYTEEKLKSRDKTLSDEDAKRIAAKAESLDLWEGIKGIDDLKGASNNLWCNYPIYFINHLDRMNALEVNPYLNMPMPNGKNALINPGFAPLHPNNPSNSRYIYQNEAYADISGFFNADYLYVVEGRAEKYKYYWHEGVDFEGYLTLGTPIKSFIYGTVEKFGMHKEKNLADSMGKYLVAKDTENKNLYYVLVHLHSIPENIYNGCQIVPGMIVGTVGQDYKKVSRPHLHISHVVADNLSQIVDERGDSFCFWLHDADAETKKRVLNPFDHTEIWKGRWTLATPEPNGAT